jgi:hypothetical protein
MNGKPVNADGSKYTGGNTSTGGHYETQYDENNDPVQVWVPD